MICIVLFYCFIVQLFGFPVTGVFQKLQSSEVEIPGVIPFTKLPHVTLRILCLNVQFTFPATEPGVPYNITVRASTAAGKGEPASIVVFSVQQGNFDQMIRYKGSCCIKSVWV